MPPDEMNGRRPEGRPAAASILFFPENTLTRSICPSVLHVHHMRHNRTRSPTIARARMDIFK